MTDEFGYEAVDPGPNPPDKPPSTSLDTACSPPPLPPAGLPLPSADPPAHPDPDEEQNKKTTIEQVVATPPRLEEEKETRKWERKKKKRRSREYKLMPEDKVWYVWALIFTVVVFSASIILGAATVWNQFF